MSSQLVRPNLTLRTMQLNAWVADNFMNIEILFYLLYYKQELTLAISYDFKNHTPLCLLLSFCSTEYLVSTHDNNKWSAWASNYVAPLDMPFLSIIA